MLVEERKKEVEELVASRRVEVERKWEEKTVN